MENEELIKEKLPKGKFTLWIENFWYHYKLHTIAALFIIVVICVVIFQMCSRPSYDIHIMYAGGKAMTHTQNSDDDYSSILTALNRVTIDYDKNGEVKTQFSNFFIPSAEELKELEEDKKADMLAPLIKSDTDSYNTNMMLSEYYICFLSEELFKERDKNQSSDLSKEMYAFADIHKYIDTEKSDYYEYASDRGIYLRSTDFYDMPGISSLPEDTVICIRILSDAYNTEDNKNYYNCCENVMKNILSYTPVG